MIFDSKLGDCYETVIAALAQHIDHLNMEISFKEQAISRLQRDLDAALADKRKLEEVMHGATKIELENSAISDFEKQNGVRYTSDNIKQLSLAECDEIAAILKGGIVGKRVDRDASSSQTF